MGGEVSCASFQDGRFSKWRWVKIRLPGHHGFLSMFPCTRVPCWVPTFELGVFWFPFRCQPRGGPPFQGALGEKKNNSGDIPKQHAVLFLVEPWNPCGTLPRRPGPPRSLFGLRPQSFQLLGKKDQIFGVVVIHQWAVYSEEREKERERHCHMKDLTSPAQIFVMLCVFDQRASPTRI